MLSYMYTRDYNDATEIGHTDEDEQIHLPPSKSLRSAGPLPKNYLDIQGTVNSAKATERSLGTIEFNVRVYIMADKYDMPILARMACEKFKDRAEEIWNEPEFAAVVGEIYNIETGSKEQLREVAVEVCKLHCLGIFAKKNKASQLLQLMRTVPEFGADLAGILAAECIESASGLRLLMNERRYRCDEPDCAKSFVVNHHRTVDAVAHCPYCGMVWSATSLAGMKV